ncbi:hypothetical protein Tco_1085983, partial [Tanacetum coccineum]
KTVPAVMKPVQSMLPSMTHVKRYGNPASGCESYRPTSHSELPNPLEKLEPPNPTVMQSHGELTILDQYVNSL